MTRPHRILLYSATPRADRGGVQRMMDDLERLLPDRGFEVARAGPDESPATGGHRLSARTDAGATGQPNLAALPAAAGALGRVARLLRRLRPNVVNIHFVTGEAVYFLALRRLFRTRVVLSAHGGDLLRPTPQMRHHLPRILAAADAVSVVSHELAGLARGYAGRPLADLRDIPNGADIAFWSPGDATIDHRHIVAAGRLLPIKGFDLLIDALTGLSDATLSIYGEGEARADLQRRIAAAGLADRVTLPGHATPEALRRALRRAQVLAMPSRGEGMPLALIEALACGCPAVATAVGGIPDVLTPEAGIVVPPEDPHALRQALAAVLDRTASCTREGARRRATAFSHAACYDAYAALLRDHAG